MRDDLILILAGLLAATGLLICANPPAVHVNSTVECVGLTDDRLPPECLEYPRGVTFDGGTPSLLELLRPAVPPYNLGVMEPADGEDVDADAAAVSAAVREIGPRPAHERSGTRREEEWSEMVMMRAREIEAAAALTRRR
jgi:hypothetical protein